MLGTCEVCSTGETYEEMLRPADMTGNYEMDDPWT